MNNNAKKYRSIQNNELVFRTVKDVSRSSMGGKVALKSVTFPNGADVQAVVFGKLGNVPAGVYLKQYQHTDKVPLRRRSSAFPAGVFPVRISAEQ